MIKLTWRTRRLILALLLSLLIALSPGVARSDGGAPALMAYSPLHLEIPSIGLNTPIVPVGLENGNPIVTPSDVDWWDGSAVPGSMGNSVFWGHLIKPDGNTGPFYKLRDVALGDEIVIVPSTRVYVVTYIALYDDQTVEYMLPTSWERLTLITCAGQAYWSGGGWRYPNRLVVMAVPRPQP